MQPSKSFFVKNKRVLRFILEISPQYFFGNVANFLLKALLPYIPIVGGALIIDGIVAKQSQSEIMTIVYWMISLSLLVGLLSAFLSDALNAEGEHVLALINDRMSRKTHALSYAQLEDNETLRLLKAADEGANGSGGVQNYIGNLGAVIGGLSNLVYSFLLLRGIFVSGALSRQDSLGLFLNNPWSALLLFGMVLVALGVSLPLLSYGSKLSYSAMKENVEGNRRFSYFYTICSDYRYGKDIRLFGMQKMLLDLQQNDKYGVNAVWEKFMHKEILLQAFVSFLYALLSFVAYGYLGLKALYGLLSIGNAVAYAGAITLLAQGLGGIIRGFVGMSLNSDYLQNYFLYLSLEEKTVYGKEKLDTSLPLKVVFSHLTFTYPRQKEKALDDISLTLEPGEKLAIVGVNGAGKTTLMKLLCRLYEPDSGTISINGLPLASYDQASLRRLSSIVFQDFRLFSFPIDENVAASDHVDEDKVVRSLKQTGIYERVLSFPQGINTLLYNKNDENGVEVSGGEAQKIATARALYKDSSLVILDEPTSALDPKSEAEVYENFNQLVCGKSAIFISHRMSSTKFCDEIAVIDKGKVVEYGNHQMLMEKEGGLYKKMWEAQAQYYR